MEVGREMGNEEEEEVGKEMRMKVGKEVGKEMRMEVEMEVGRKSVEILRIYSANCTRGVAI